MDFWRLKKSVPPSFPESDEDQAADAFPDDYELGHIINSNAIADPCKHYVTSHSVFFRPLFAQSIPLRKVILILA